MPVVLAALPPAVISPATDTSQRFLASAYDSVEGITESLEIVRTARNARRGRLTDNEVDLVRAAVVFAGAGLDATLKQLIRDALPSVIEDNEQARKKFEIFAADAVAGVEAADPKRVARYLVAQHPRTQLIDDYIRSITGDSLQSVEQVHLVAGALGINDAGLRQRINSLVGAFKARNEVSHELDLQRPEKPGDRHRRARSATDSIETAHELLEVTQLIVNAVAEANSRHARQSNR